MGGINIRSEKSYVDFFLGSIGLVSILIVTMGVFTRFVLHVSISWSDELLRTIFVWAYFIGTAMQFKDFGLMRLELLDESMRKRGNTLAYNILIRLQNFIIALFSSIVLYNAVILIRNQVINKQVTTTSGVPAWIIPVGFAIGMTFLTIFAVVRLIRPLLQTKDL